LWQRDGKREKGVGRKFRKLIDPDRKGKRGGGGKRRWWGGSKGGMSEFTGGVYVLLGELRCHGSGPK